jgi:hypothetical protein
MLMKEELILASDVRARMSVCSPADFASPIKGAFHERFVRRSLSASSGSAETGGAALARTNQLSEVGDMTESDLQKKCDQLSWFHSIELAPGITTKGVKSPEILAHEVPLIFGPIKMAGLSVLDIGAWNGFFSFETGSAKSARYR